MSYGYIYLIKDHFTNKVYVGKSQSFAKHDLKNYFGSGKIIKRIIKKRRHHLSKIILGYCRTENALNKAEKTCIEFFDARNRIYGHNISDGGEGTDTISHNPNKKEIISQMRHTRIKNGTFKIYKFTMPNGETFFDTMHNVSLKYHLARRTLVNWVDCGVIDIYKGYHKFVEAKNCNGWKVESI